MAEPCDTPPEVGGPDDRLLPWPAVREIAGISRATAWRMQQVGDFPEPVPISPNRVGWWASELNAWKATRRAGAHPPPKPVRRPRAPRLIQTVPIPAPARPAMPMSQGVSPVPDTVSVPTGSGMSAPLRPAKARRRQVTPAPGQIDFGF